jgi:hypothetical protein
MKLHQSLAVNRFDKFEVASSEHKGQQAEVDE